MTTRSTDIARDFELGTINEIPMIASDIIYEGSAIGDNGSGYARPLVAGDPFLGFAESNADNSAAGSSAGDVKVRLRTEGLVKLSITSASILDVGKSVYATDDDTFVLKSVMVTPGTYIGFIERYISSGVAMVRFKSAGADDYVSNSPLVGVGRQRIGDALTTTQHYPLGTILRKPDGREFRYGKAGATIGGNLGAHNHDDQHITHTTVAADAAAGDVSIVIDVASPMGSSADGSVALNELAGGYILIFVDGSGADQKCFIRGIVSNTAVTSGSHEMTVVVDDPIPVALVADTAYAEAIASPYRNLQQTNASGKAVVGVPTQLATSGQYLWIQTKGPIWVSPQPALGVTVAQEAVFRHDGSFDAHEYNDAYATTAQHAGYCIANSAGAQGAPFVMLDI